MKGKFKYIATMAAGVVLALAIICSNVWTNRFTKEKEVAKTEQNSDTTSDVFSAPTLSPPSVFHVNLSLDVFCLFDLTYESSDEDSEACDPIEPPKLLLTLFRVIISPNAP
jgi:hypothetical protein